MAIVRDAHTILPPNSTQLEYLLELVSANALNAIDVPVRSVWDPHTCPVDLLPWLAWAYGVVEWNTSWSEAVKRSAINNALYIHSKRGTLAAIERAIAAVGYNITIVEWFESAGPAYTFTAVINASSGGLVDTTLYSTLERLINDAKNVRSHLLSITTVVELPGNFYSGGATATGDTVVISGTVPVNLNITIQAHQGAALTTHLHSNIVAMPNI